MQMESYLTGKTFTCMQHARELDFLFLFRKTFVFLIIWKYVYNRILWLLAITDNTAVANATALIYNNWLR